MAVNLDTRLPLAAISGPLNPAGIIRQAQEFRQQQASNDIAQKLQELRLDYENRKRKREADTEQYMGEAINTIRQGKPAQTVTDFQWNTPNQTGVPQSPYEVSAREIAPAVPGRQPTLEDMQSASIDAMFRSGDIQGAFEAMKAARAGQTSQMKPFGGETKIGADGQAYALNQATGRYEPTGFYPQPKAIEQPKPVAVRTDKGTEFVIPTPGMVLKPPAEKATSAKPRYQVITDSSGTYRVNLDNPSDVVQIHKPGGAPIFKPKTEATPSVDESKNAGFYKRMTDVTPMLDKYEKAGKPTITTTAIGGVPLVGGLMQRGVMSDDQAAYKNAAMAWVRAKLRKESGAVIGDDEAKGEYETYFPMPNDSPLVIRQKQELRRIATEEMRLSAGKAAVPASGEQQRKRSTVPAVGYLKSLNINTQDQFNAAVRKLKASGWTDDEIREAAAKAGL